MEVVNSTSFSGGYDDLPDKGGGGDNRLEPSVGINWKWEMSTSAI